MTDNTSAIAGNYEGGIKITCILDEGAPTIVDSFDQMGLKAKSYTFATPLAYGDVVAISNDTAATYAACGGNPLVEKPANGETLVIGRIVSVPELQTMAANDAAADTLAERLAGDYYRTATVEIWGGITKIMEATLMQDGSNACAPGVGATLSFNITSGYATDDAALQLDAVASGGVGIIPFHYAAAGSDGDTLTILVGLTGMLIAATGA